MGMLDEDIEYTLAAYLRDRAAEIAIFLVCAAALFGMLLVLGVNWQGACICICSVALAAGACFACGYRRQARYFKELLAASRAIEYARELPALLAPAQSLEAKAAQEALELVATASADEVARISEEERLHRGYVDMWVHEVKTPIAACKLALARMRGADATRLRREVERIERQVEQVLYYTRVRDVQVDYTIREIALAELVRECCRACAGMLIDALTTPEVRIDERLTVLADRQWLLFALGQLASNAAKYGASHLTFTAEEFDVQTSDGRVVLTVADDGWGIPSADMPRIFDAGFTGENGRRAGSATGMGLHLVASMCSAMGIGLECVSEQGTGTRFMLVFPLNRRS